MEHIEMLVAAQVRDLAVILRTNDVKKALEEAGYTGKTQENRDQADQYVDRWLKQNPISMYVPDAHKLIHEVALQIQSLA
jgi:hypothetical protein